MKTSPQSEERTGLEIAIIGMSGRFPGANGIDAYWELLRNGVEAITCFSDEEMLADGVDPEVLKLPNYVRAASVLEGSDRFDAEFFAYNPKEAAAIDPQQRIFLETAWEALEHAGYNPESYTGSIGVYAGAGLNSYVLHAYADPSLSQFLAVISNDKDFLTTRVSYKLNLRGPSLDVQTACSTSLVAVHLAVQGLLSGECDMALAGGVAIKTPQKAGYLYQEGGISSPDGHCRAFDARAQGTVVGNGAGIVVLKRLEDALADGDTIYAIIRGSAINNDGSLKVGYTAPGIDGQAAVIRAAQVMAGIDPATITYIEAHGTGTALGDPIEIAALSQVFREHTQAAGFCAIGSVKTNIGHLDTAAGIAGLIKVVLALKHAVIPPSLHFEQPNPNIDFARSPFYVNAKLTPWASPGVPRRAAISSFGLGGTNAHVILEAAPDLEPAGESRPWQLLALSARTDTALDTATHNLAEHLRQHPGLRLADVAYTLQVGRKAFNHRRVVICHDRQDAISALGSLDHQRVLTSALEKGDPQVVFMFPGQGSQYPHMARGLYESEPVFQEQVVRCAELLAPQLGFDLRAVLFADEQHQEVATERLTRTAITQPALFTIEYGLAHLWMTWGIVPQAMIGHSLGEYVAACLAGVLSLEDALMLVAARGRLMQSLPGGTMLSVPLAEAQVLANLDATLSLAAVNGPDLCVVSGSDAAVADYVRRLAEQGIETQVLHTSHAFHSQMMDAILEPFTEYVQQVRLQPPQIPYISNITGTWITAAEATDPAYWATHLRQAVRFAPGMAELLREPGRVLLEVGPGRTLSTFARRQAAGKPTRTILPSLRHPHDSIPDEAFLLQTLGQLWLAGVRIDWAQFSAHERRRRVALPTYPFERRRYWLERPAQIGGPRQRQSPPAQRAALDDWFSVPSWERAPLPGPSERSDPDIPASRLLVFLNPHALGNQLMERFQQAGQKTLTVVAGKSFSELGNDAYTLNPERPTDYDALFEHLAALDKVPCRILYLWSLTPNGNPALANGQPERLRPRSFSSLLFLARALGKHLPAIPIQIDLVTNNAQDVTGNEWVFSEQTLLAGPCRVISHEYPHITCRSIDIAVAETGVWQTEQSLAQLLAELAAPPTSDAPVAHRGGNRWVQTYTPRRLDKPGRGSLRLREGGVYVIVGGFEGFGLILAEALARQFHARLTFTIPGAFPARSGWAGWLASHDEHDDISRAIRKVQALEAAGAQVLIANAAVTEPKAMQEALAQTYARFGAVHGVFYTMGSAGDVTFQAIRDICDSASAQQLLADVYGLRVLECVLPRHGLDFCVLQSPLSSVLGGMGLVGRAATSAYMDAIARACSRTHAYPWLSVAWDRWHSEADNRTPIADGAISPQEGLEALSRALAAGVAGPVLIATTDLQTRIDLRRREMGVTEETAQQDAGTSRHSRPNLPHPYVAPRNELEQIIAETWQDMLGIEQIGIYDNFFELGGHSLLITQIVSQLRSTFAIDLPLRRLFDAQTVAEVAVALVQALAEQEEAEAMHAILAEIEQLPG